MLLSLRFGAANNLTGREQVSSPAAKFRPLHLAATQRTLSFSLTRSSPLPQHSYTWPTAFSSGASYVQPSPRALASLSPFAPLRAPTSCRRSSWLRFLSFYLFLSISLSFLFLLPQVPLRLLDAQRLTMRISRGFSCRRRRRRRYISALESGTRTHLSHSLAR